MSVKQEVYNPFGRRTEDVINPYSFDAENQHEHPLVGLDGGILIPAQAIVDLKDGYLSRYLQKRTIATGSTYQDPLYAATHSPTGEYEFHKAPPGTWLSSRGERYYMPNFGFNREATKGERREILKDNLQDDAHLIRNWRAVLSDISYLDQETRWRVVNTIFQNFSTDFIGLYYAAEVSTDYNDSMAEIRNHISKQVFNAVTQYYRSLSDPSCIPSDISSFMAFQNAPYLLQYLSTNTEEGSLDIDDIRTQRETDMTFVTLAGAKTFYNEFADIEYPKNSPAVIIPLLGAYDLGPALRAVGYQGEIHYILPAHKLLSRVVANHTETRNQIVEQDITEELSPHLRAKEVVVFDDSVGTGKTLFRIGTDLENFGILPKAIRTLFINDKWHPQAHQFLKVYENQYRPYFSCPVRRQDNLQKGEQFIFHRWVSQKWLKKTK